MNSFSGIIKKRKTFNKETFLTVVSEVISGFLWDIFVTLMNTLTHKTII